MGAVAQKLKDQITLVNKALNLSFDSVNADRADKALNALCDYLESQGTTSILDLKQYVNPAANLNFYFDVKSGVTFSQSNYTMPDAAAPLTKNLFFVWYPHDISTKYYYFLVFTPDGYPVFVVHSEYMGNDWHDVMSLVIFVGSSVVGYAFPALGTTIGSAVMGAQAAAAYPAIAAAIGNAAIGTVMSGGDVKTAVAAAVGGLAGGYVGTAAMGVTDSAMIGNAASAATRALITGGDLETAVAQSLIKTGASNAGAFFSTPSTDVSVPSGGDMSDWFDDIDNWDTNPTIDPQTGLIVSGDGLQSVFDQTPGDALFDLGSVLDPSAFDFSNVVYNAASPNPPAAANGVVANVGGVNLMQAALQALQLVGAYKAAGQPAVRASSATTQVNSNGTITTRNTAGGATTVQMPAGTPYLASNGTLVTNNGNGTYTTVYPDGHQTINAYSAVGSLGSLSTLLQGNTPLYIGGALLAVLLLSRRSS